MVSECFGFTFHAKPSLKKFQAKILTFTHASMTFYIFSPFCMLKLAKKTVTLQLLMIESQFLA